MTALAREAESAWQRIEVHIATKKTTAYDQAVALLAELRDAYAHTGRAADFDQRLRKPRQGSSGKQCERRNVLGHERPEMPVVERRDIRQLQPLRRSDH